MGEIKHYIFLVNWWLQIWKKCWQVISFVNQSFIIYNVDYSTDERGGSIIISYIEFSIGTMDNYTYIDIKKWKNGENMLKNIDMYQKSQFLFINPAEESSKTLIKQGHKIMNKLFLEESYFFTTLKKWIKGLFVRNVWLIISKTETYLNDAISRQHFLINAKHERLNGFLQIFTFENIILVI